MCWGLDNNLTALVSGFTPAQTTVVKGMIAGAVNLTLGLSLGQHFPALARLGAGTHLANNHLTASREPPPMKPIDRIKD